MQGFYPLLAKSVGPDSLCQLPFCDGTAFPGKPVAWRDLDLGGFRPVSGLGFLVEGLGFAWLNQSLAKLSGNVSSVGNPTLHSLHDS